MIRTKIIATMGPATADVETLYRLFDEGVDVCRLNFSHGTLDDHKAMLDKIREAAKRFHHPVGILRPRSEIARLSGSASGSGGPRPVSAASRTSSIFSF